MTITVAGGQGFYGDHVASTKTLLDAGVDYLCLEALAELTLAILQKDRQKDETKGFTKDLPAYLGVALPHVAEGKTKVITNAGGINPVAAGRAAVETAKRLGISGIRIATVVGDDLHGRLGETAAANALDNLETGEPWSAFPSDTVLFANAYLGARPIVDALRQGADVVITGRVADQSLFLAPLVHVFDWADDDWDRLAAGIVVGHLCECSGQSTGGNFSGEWWTIPEPWKFAYPIAECEADGTAVITKAPGTGGRVDFDTVRHQLLYEVHDPTAYVTPDVVADFTSLTLDDLGGDRVRVTGVRGKPATDTYKALVAYPYGFSSESRVAFAWPDAYAKAKAAAHVFWERVAMAGLDGAILERHEEYFGVNALGGATVPLDDDRIDAAPEVVVRLAWRCADAATAGRIGREMVPLALSAPPWGMTGTGRGMGGSPSELMGLWPTLVPKNLVDPGVRIDVVDV
jgi:hypothetical protein